MDWKTYEEVTRYIYETLGKQIGVKIVGHGRKFKLMGKSGVSYQIDVLTSHSDGIHDYLTDIECKYWNKKVNNDTIMKVDSIVKDCNFNKGVVVSKFGFTPDTIKYAKSVNVGLVTLREPTAEDWAGRTKTIILVAHNHVPHITRFENTTVEVYKDISGMIQTDKYFYLLENGIKKSMKDYIEEFQEKLQNGNITNEITDEFIFPKPIFLVDSDGNNISKVIGIKISGKVDITTSKTIIHGEDSVWLIMKSIFEDKTYTISKDGEIRDVSN